jgi:hypothetical protein
MLSREPTGERAPFMPAAMPARLPFNLRPPRMNLMRATDCFAIRARIGSPLTSATAEPLAA